MTNYSCEMDSAKMQMYNYSHGNTSYNMSSEDYTDLSIGPKIIYIFLVIIIILLSLFVCFGNGLILTAIAYFPHLRTATNVAIGSLAISDFLTGLLLGPIYITLFYTPSLKYVVGRKYPCLFVASLMILVAATSMTSVALIATDRYIAVSLPLRYHTLITVQRTVFVLGAFYLYSVTIAIMPLLGSNILSDNATNIACSDIDKFPDFYVCLLLFSLLIVLIVTTVLYGAIGIIAYKQKRRIQTENLNFERSQQQHKDYKITKMLSMVLGLFYLCWSPVGIYIIVKLYNRHGTVVILMQNGLK